LQLPREVKAALDRAAEAASEITPQHCTGLFSDWSTSRLQVYEGTCHVLLGESTKAITTLEPVLKSLANDRTATNVLLAARVDLARAYGDVGELEQACSLLGATYEQLRGVGNHRGIGRARRAREQLAQWNSEPAVLQLDAIMNAA
jgi:hypothetical protein